MMGDATAIEWTDATWNPVTGCTAVSSGCDHCYAQTLAERFRGTPGHYFEHGFDVEMRPGKLDQPLRWSRPRRIFVNSMSDLFHPAIPDDYIARVFAVIALARQHTFQLLTKRPARMRALLQSDAFRRAVDDAIAGVVAAFRPADVWYQSWPLPNLWIGVSAEDQKTADLASMGAAGHACSSSVRLCRTAPRTDRLHAPTTQQNRRSADSRRAPFGRRLEMRRRARTSA